MNFNEVNRLGQIDFLPTKKLSSLETGKKYKITNVKQVKTKFGERIVVEIKDSFTVFLPQRVCKFIIENQDYLKNLSEECKNKNIYLEYFGGKLNKIKFGYIAD